MQCVNCGKEISSAQNFCRFCGTSLMTNSGVSSSDKHSISRSEVPRAKVTTRVARRRMNRLLLWGLIVIGLGITLLANAQDYVWINWVGISVFIAGLGLTAYGVFSPDKSLPAGQTAAPGTLKESTTTPSLPGKDSLDYVPSVTERTTELFDRKQAHSRPRTGDETDRQ